MSARAARLARGAARRKESVSYRAARREEVAAYQRAYRAVHPEERIPFYQAYQAVRREKIAARRAAYRQERAAYRAGIDPATVPPIPNDCALCGLPFGTTNGDRPQLDHRHGPNPIFRGWVHGRCNSALIGANDVASAEKVLAYLKRTEGA